jgi:hypothetical protein
MVPRGGLPRSNEIKELQIGGTPRLPTGSLGFLPCVSHKAPARRPTPRHDPNAFQFVLIASPSVEADGRRAASGRGSLFDAHLEGEERVLVRRTHQPFLDACRVLVADGVDPRAWIVTRRAGSKTHALIAKVGAAAKLSVKEGDEPPRLRPWTPFPSRPVESSMRFQEQAAGGIADGDQNAPATSPGGNCLWRPQ